ERVAVLCAGICVPHRLALPAYTTLFRSHRIHDIGRHDDDELRLLAAEAVRAKERAEDRDIAEARELLQFPLDIVLEEACDRKARSEEHTSELQSRDNLVCRLLLDTKMAL